MLPAWRDICEDNGGDIEEDIRIRANIWGQGASAAGCWLDSRIVMLKISIYIYEEVFAFNYKMVGMNQESTLADISRGKSKCVLTQVGGVQWCA